jgi:hypothetical protein
VVYDREEDVACVLMDGCGKELLVSQKKKPQKVAWWSFTPIGFAMRPIAQNLCINPAFSSTYLMYPNLIGVRVDLPTAIQATREEPEGGRGEAHRLHHTSISAIELFTKKIQWEDPR